MEKAVTPSLYEVFEEHLFGPNTLEDVSTDDFIDLVVADYLARLMDAGAIIAEKQREDVFLEFKDEVQKMTRVKTYGYLNLAEFKKSRSSNGP